MILSRELWATAADVGTSWRSKKPNFLPLFRVYLTGVTVRDTPPEIHVGIGLESPHATTPISLSRVAAYLGVLSCARNLLLQCLAVVGGLGRVGTPWSGAGNEHDRPRHHRSQCGVV